MNKWPNIPNAKHIDWVIQSLKDNPNEWAVAYDAEYNTANKKECRAVREAAWDTAWNAAREAALISVVDAVVDAVLDAGYYAARNAVLALIVYDGIEHYFLSSYEELRLISELSQHPAAILLLPAVKARELIEAKNERVV